jgi:transposase InsO family protein
MPWKYTQAMDQRIEFAMKALSHPNFGELCRQYGISRKTGYKWRERFVSHGLDGMGELSRRPHSHAQQLSEDIVCAMVSLKHAHPHWGPRKIRELYRRAHRGAEPPSESSFKRVLDKAGLTEPRKRRPATESGRLARGIKAQSPNDIWSVDFKGWWHDNSGQRIEPLTVRDEHSRMILELRAVPDARADTVRASFEQLFEKHGLPAAIRSDNGPPFASANGLLGLSKLSAWWLALGIDLERSRPGCPQDNGAHERMHLDVRRELQTGRLGRSQESFDQWRHEFNTQRPHEALGMATPAEIYTPSARIYEGTPEQLDYQGKETRRVKITGHIVFRSQPVFLSQSLSGWDIALGGQTAERIELWFANLLLGHLHADTVSFQPITPGATGTLAASATLQRPKCRSTPAPTLHTKSPKPTPHL